MARPALATTLALLLALPVAPGVAQDDELRSPGDIAWGYPVAVHALFDRYRAEAEPALEMMRADGTARARPAPAIPTAAHEYDEAVFFAGRGFVPQAFEELTEFWAKLLYHRVRRDVESNGTSPAEAYYGTGKAYLDEAPQILALHREGMRHDFLGGLGPKQLDYILYSSLFAVVATYEGDKAYVVQSEAPDGPPSTGVGVAYLAMAFSSWWYARLAADLAEEGRVLGGTEPVNVSRESLSALVDVTYPAVAAWDPAAYEAPVTGSYAGALHEYYDRRAEGPHFEALYVAAEIEWIFAVAMEDAGNEVGRPFSGGAAGLAPAVARAREEAGDGFLRVTDAGFLGLGITHHLDALDLFNLSRSEEGVAGPGQYGHAAAALEAMRSYDFLIQENGLAPAAPPRDLRPVLMVGAALLGVAGFALFAWALRRRA